MIQVQDWAEIRHLYFAEELSQRAIAERLGVARKTVVLRARIEWEREPPQAAFPLGLTRIG